jgi:hypothetical protein
MNNLETAGYESPVMKPLTDQQETAVQLALVHLAAMCGAEAHVQFKTGKTEIGYDKDLGFDRAFFNPLPKEHPEAETKIITRLYRNKQ